MVIEKDTILYFTGTGNSLQVAKDISDELGGIELYPLASLADEEEIEIKAMVFGIVFPTYFACLPLIVEKTAKKLKINKETYVFAVSTQGGSPGAVLKQLNDILQEKGEKLDSGFLVNMPGNYIVKYGAFPLIMQNRAFNRKKNKVKEIAAIVGARKGRKYELSKLVIDRIFTKTMHKGLENTHIKDKEFWANENCNACGTCERICPVKNIELSENKPAWKHNCEQCMACIQWCPKEAIQYSNKTLKRARYRNPYVNLSGIISSSAKNR